MPFGQMNKTAEIKDGWLVIPKQLSVKKIDIKKITRIVCGERIQFFSGDQLLYNTAWNDQIQKVAQEIYSDYECTVLEYSNTVIDKWTLLPESQFQSEVQKKAVFLEKELQKYREKVDFEIHHEIEVNEEALTAMLKVWGERDGEKVFLFPGGKQNLLWGGVILFIAPKIMSKNPSESIIALDKECDTKFRKMIETSISGLDSYGWRSANSHAPTGEKKEGDIIGSGR